MNTGPRAPREPLSDTELASLAKQGDAGAFSELSHRFTPVLQARAARYANIVGVDVEDFVQEGMLALFRAVKGYNSGTGIQFSTYAITCINNSMTSAIRSHMKDSMKNSHVNLYDIDEQNLRKDPLYFAAKPLEDAFIEMEQSNRRARQIETLLSEFERQVLKRYLSGHSYQEIADVLSTTTKAVDNALQRVRRKLRPEL